MSFSHQKIALPQVKIPETWRHEVKRIAILALDLTTILAVFDDAIDDLIFSAEPGQPAIASLWEEVEGYISNINDTWVESLQGQLEDAMSLLPIQQPLEGAPAAKFLDGTTVTLAGIMEMLTFYQDGFYDKLELWREAYPYLMKSPATKITMRTLPEITMEAILVFRRDWSTASRRDIDEWFGSLRDNRVLERTTNPLNIGRESFNSDASRQSFKLKPKPHALDVGGVACVSAVWTGAKLVTGSTLVKWGDALSKVVLVQPPSGSKPGYNLQLWTKELRQRRFTNTEQLVLNHLVLHAIGDYTKRFQKFTSLTEKGMRDQIKHLQGADKALRLNQLAVAKKTAMQDMQRHWNSVLPAVVRKLFGGNDSPVLGMAYEGQSFDMKRKCPVCATIYIFPVARSDEVAQLRLDWQTVGEADTGRMNSPRGCCAEAITFIRCVVELGAFEACRHQLGY